MSISAPGTPTFTYTNYANTITLTWTASSTTPPEILFYYEVQWSTSPSFTGYSQASTNIPSITRTLTPGYKYYFRVRAVATNGTRSAFSGTANKYMLYRGTNDWTNFTNIASNITTTFNYEDDPTYTGGTTGTKYAGLHKKVTQNSTTSTTYTAGSNYIYRDFTGLTVGRQYRVTATAKLGTAGIQGDLYRLQVNTTTPTVGSNITLTTTEATVPSVTFTATSTTHRVRFELNETFTQTSTGTKEDFLVYNMKVELLSLDTGYRLQPHARSMSVLEAFNLATQSVGAYWWVDKKNETNFSQLPVTTVSSATFTDDSTAGALHYQDIECGYDSRNIVNSTTIQNIGRLSENGDDDLTSSKTKWNDVVVEYTSTDATSVDNWGSRALSLPTNIYLPYVRNFVTNGSVESGKDNNKTVPTSATDRSRKVANLSASISNGTTDWGTVGGERCYYIELTTAPTDIEVFFNDDDRNKSIAVVAGNTYYAVAYAARLSGPANTQFRATIRWYNESGGTISTSNGTYVSTTAATWLAATVSGTAPAGAVAASVRVHFTRADATAFVIGNKMLVDCVGLFDGNVTTYFDGNTPASSSYIYGWYGTENNSASVRYENKLATRGSAINTKFSSPVFNVSSIRWNAAENYDLAYTFDIGQYITVKFKGVTGTYRIVGIQHEMNPNEWFMTFELTKAEV